MINAVGKGLINHVTNLKIFRALGNESPLLFENHIGHFICSRISNSGRFFFETQKRVTSFYRTRTFRQNLGATKSRKSAQIFRKKICIFFYFADKSFKIVLKLLNTVG